VTDRDRLAGALRDEIRAWLAESWDEDITVREWWRRLAEARLSAPQLPEPFGRGYSGAQSRVVTEVLAAARTIAPPLGNVGLRLAVPTLLRHGTPEQIGAYVPPLLRGEEGWCQLFSEPGAGSDLPGLSTRAVADGDEWVVDGQKVWSSGADVSRWGMLLARTDPQAPKREGISFFVIDMRQPGVQVRPLRTMNDEADFCEVFLTEARVRAADLIGELDRGWTVARTTLQAERASAADAAARGLISLPSGEEAGHLDRRVSEVLAARRPARFRASAIRSSNLIRLAQERGVADDPTIRQGLARYWSLTQVHRLMQQRARTGAASMWNGAEGSVAKLALGRICHLSRDLSFAILGADAMRWGDDAVGDLVRTGLSSPGVTIGAGTDEIQRTTIGERALGLPREPDREPDAGAGRP
jgi:alkylation response protein AidB-like acyl-CoA dehydrogenase